MSRSQIKWKQTKDDSSRRKVQERDGEGSMVSQAGLRNGEKSSVQAENTRKRYNPALGCRRYCPEAVTKYLTETPSKGCSLAQRVQSMCAWLQALCT